MEYHQIIEDWRNWAKTGVMPKRARCTLNQSRTVPSLSPFFSEDDLLSFDRKLASLSQKHPLAVRIFKMRHLYGMTYRMIGEKLQIPPKDAERAAENVAKKALM